MLLEKIIDGKNAGYINGNRRPKTGDRKKVIGDS